MDPVVTTVSAELCKIDETFADRTYLLAVSGGCDSMVMLRIFRTLFPPEKLVVAHFNHGLRGNASEADAALVRDTATAAGLIFECANRRTGPASEATLREERRAFLETLALRHHVDYIVTAHHAEDQLETFLMRLIRGSGLDGLRAIPARLGKWLRPMLPLTRKELANYGREQGILFREDETNQETIFFRNQIRHRLVPHLIELTKTFGGPSPFYRRFLELTREIEWATTELREQGESSLSPALVRTTYWDRLSAPAFLECSGEWQRRWLREILRPHVSEPMTRIQIEELRDGLLARKKNITAARDIAVRYSCGYFFFQSRAQRERLAIVTPADLGIEFSQTANEEMGELRFYQPGDRLNGKRLKKIFLEEKIPAPERRIIPVMAHPESSDVTWVFPMTQSGMSVTKLAFPFSFLVSAAFGQYSLRGSDCAPDKISGRQPQKYPYEIIAKDDFGLVSPRNRDALLISDRADQSDGEETHVQ